MGSLTFNPIPTVSWQWNGQIDGSLQLKLKLSKILYTAQNVQIDSQIAIDLKILNVIYNANIKTLWHRQKTSTWLITL